MNKYYRLTVKLKPEQELQVGKFIFNALNITTGLLDTYVAPIPIVQFSAIDFLSLKRIINSLDDLQIQEITVKYE